VIFTGQFEPYEVLGVGVLLFRDNSQYQTQEQHHMGKEQEDFSIRQGSLLCEMRVDIVGRIIKPFKGLKV